MSWKRPIVNIIIIYSGVLEDLPSSARDARDTSSIPGSERYPGEGNGTHSIISAWKIPQTEELGGLSLWGRKELDMTEHTHI